MGWGCSHNCPQLEEGKGPSLAPGLRLIGLTLEIADPDLEGFLRTLRVIQTSSSHRLPSKSPTRMRGVRQRRGKGAERGLGDDARGLR